MGFIKNISSSFSDASIVEDYKQTGNMQALADLYQRYMEMVYAVCLKYMKEPEDAKDCVINIFEELVPKLKKYEIENFRGWLYQLAINHCLMKLRSKKRLPVHIDHEFVHLEEKIHLEEVMEKEAHFGMMEYCIGQLVTEQRQVIQLFYLQEQCYKSISATTGLDTNRVRSYIQNGRRNLKICMENQALKNI